MSLAKLPFKMLSDTIFAHCLGQVSNPEVSSLAYHFAAWCASLGPLRRPLFWSRRESNHSLTHCGLIGNILDYFNIYAQHCAQLSIDWRHDDTTALLLTHHTRIGAAHFSDDFHLALLSLDSSITHNQSKEPSRTFQKQNHFFPSIFFTFRTQFHSIISTTLLSAAAACVLLLPYLGHCLCCCCGCSQNPGALLLLLLADEHSFAAAVSGDVWFWYFR